MSSATLLLINDTSQEVTFGIYNAPDNKNITVKVPGNRGQAKQTIGNVDTARIIAAWTAKDQLFPSNDKPACAGILFESAQQWTVTLTNDGFTVTS